MFMKKRLVTGFLALALFAVQGVAQDAQNDDPRTLVQMEPQMQQQFLALMRGFLDSIDDMMSALAEGDFREVARIAGEDLGPAHELMKKLRAAKVPEKKIAEIRKRVRQHMAAMIEKGEDAQRMHMGMGRIVMQVLGEPLPGMQMGAGKRKPQGFGGFGRVLPPEMHQMGMQMHLAAAQIADVAAAVGDKPTAQDYQKVLGAIGEFTGQCRACHAAWRLR